MATFEIEGIPQLKAALRKAGDRAPKALASAFYIEAEKIMRASREIVPVSSGRLKGSAVVQLPEINMSGVSIEFGYGGAASTYAAAVHERLDLHHPVGRAKFLEEPTLEAAHGMGQRMAVTIRKYLERR